jgi:hypothetical protein
MSTNLLRNPLVNEGRTLIDDLMGEQQLLPRKTARGVALFCRAANIVAEP